jgi:hypothetical protein
VTDISRMLQAAETKLQEALTIWANKTTATPAKRSSPAVDLDGASAKRQRASSPSDTDQLDMELEELDRQDEEAAAVKAMEEADAMKAAHKAKNEAECKAKEAEVVERTKAKEEAEQARRVTEDMDVARKALAEAEAERIKVEAAARKEGELISRKALEAVSPKKAEHVVDDARNWRTSFGTTAAKVIHDILDENKIVGDEQDILVDDEVAMVDNKVAKVVIELQQPVGSVTKDNKITGDEQDILVDDEEAKAVIELQQPVGGVTKELMYTMSPRPEDEANLGDGGVSGEGLKEVQAKNEDKGGSVAEDEGGSEEHESKNGDIKAMLKRRKLSFVYARDCITCSPLIREGVLRKNRRRAKGIGQ